MSPPHGSLRAAAGFVVAILVTGTLAFLSGLPVELHEEDRAQLRFSWRLDRVVVERCTRLDAEARDRTPEHMRRDEVCSERSIPYRLRVTLDGEEILDRRVRAGGARGDRPLAVFFQEPVSPGAYRLEVRFDPDLSDFPAGDADIEAADLPSLELAAPLTLGSRSVALVTWDRDAGELRLRTPEPPERGRPSTGGGS